MDTVKFLIHDKPVELLKKDFEKFSGLMADGAALSGINRSKDDAKKNIDKMHKATTILAKNGYTTHLNISVDLRVE